MSARLRLPRAVEAPLSGLRPWLENPRFITPARLEDLQRSLEADREMLGARPLVALPDGTVIMGNQRLLAARELGWQTVPVITVDLDPVRVRERALRDNNAYGEWDERALADILQGLAREEVDLALSGFETSELDRLLAGFETAIDPDDAPPLPAEPDSELGQVYELGSHRVLCGDATDPRQLARLMGGELAEVMWTDPPYGLDYVGKTPRALRIQNDDPGGLAYLLKRGFAAVDTALAPLGRLYIASPGGLLGLTFRQAFVDAGWELHQTLVWAKQAFVLGHCDYHYAHEDVLYGWKPGPGRPGRGRHRGSRWQGDNSQATVFHVDRPSRSEDHPTQKPVALIEAMLRNSSRRGDIVLDPFAGSGSTMVACERLGRRCYAVELDPAYCDVIRRRYQELAADG